MGKRPVHDFLKFDLLTDVISHRNTLSLKVAKESIFCERKNVLEYFSSINTIVTRTAAAAAIPITPAGCAGAN